MQVFLASIPLEGRAVLVVGGGEPAIAKARLLSATPAELRWFAPRGLEGDSADLTPPRPGWPQEADLDRAALLFVAVGAEEEAEAAELAAQARARRILVNVVDRPALSDFQTPALVDRGDVVVGIATGGVAPVMARDLRARIEAALPQGVRALARAARLIRPEVVASPLDGLQRRRFWEAALRGEAAQATYDGREAEALTALRRLLAEGPLAPRGVVHIVGAGPGDPERLTLRALRLLQDADLVIQGEGVPDAIASLARRDARRTTDVAHLEAEVASGHRVVRLVAGSPGEEDEREAQALRAAGIEAHVEPGLPL